MLTELERKEIVERVMAETRTSAGLLEQLAATNFVAYWDVWLEKRDKVVTSAHPRDWWVLHMALHSYWWFVAHVTDIQTAALDLSERLSRVQTMRIYRPGLEAWLDNLEAKIPLSEWAKDPPEDYRKRLGSDAKWLDNAMGKFAEQIGEIVGRPKPHRPKGRTKTAAFKVKERQDLIQRIETKIEARLRNKDRITKTLIARDLGCGSGANATELQTFAKRLKNLEIDYKEILREARARLDREIKPKNS